MEHTAVKNSEQVVLDCINAINNEDFAAAKRLVREDMTFDGVLGARQGADAYFKDMEKMRLKYNLRKSFAKGDDVCLLYDMDMAGQKIFVCGWYHLENGKIASLKVVFDPRPVLEKK